MYNIKGTFLDYQFLLINIPQSWITKINNNRVFIFEHVESKINVTISHVICLVLTPATVYSYGFLFNCTTAGQFSDSMTALT